MLKGLFSFSFAFYSVLVEMGSEETRTNLYLSDYSYPQATMMSSAPAMFSSYSQTGPADLVPSWETTAEGVQNFHDYSDNGSAHPGDEEYTAYPLHGHISSRGHGHSDTVEDLQGKWPTSAGVVATPMGGEPMRRGTSRTSTGSHKHRALKATASKGRSRMSSTISSKLSNLGMTGNSTAFGNGPANGQMDMSQMFLDDASSVSSHLYYSSPPMDYLHPDGLPYSTAGLTLVPAEMDLIPDAAMTGHSPPTPPWDAFSVGASRTPSPQGFEDAFSVAAAGSPTHTHNSSPLATHHSPAADISPILPGQSPRYVLPDCSLAQEPHSHVVEFFRTSQSLGTQNTYEDFAIMPGEEYSLPPSLCNRRHSNEGESARDHPLYRTATTQADGLYHCPWEGESNCTHKPEKLKCNYE
jgi:hypothetical protein